MKEKSKVKISGTITKDIILSVLIVLSAFAVCFLLKQVEYSNIAVPLIFSLAVFLISLYTDGYIYGILFSFISVLCVNYFFTHHYFTFNFTLSGYPVTIISVFSVSIITGILTTQAKKQEKIKLEAENEKTRSNLLRSVSHDLRTPLTSILGASCAIIENDELLSKEDRLQLVTEIKDDTQWLMQIVENLLAITRINNSGDAKIIKRPEYVEEVVADAVQKFHKRFEDFNVNVSVPDEPLIIHMDAILIEQVIINLLENAAIHSKTVSKVDLAIFLQDNYVVFKVSDNGVGIPSRVLPHIFDGGFSHDEEIGPDSKKNMGIGLSVCYSIIKAHGGNMMAENSKNGGAVFRFTLPKEVAANEQ